MAFIGIALIIFIVGIGIFSWIFGWDRPPRRGGGNSDGGGIGSDGGSWGDSGGWGHGDGDGGGGDGGGGGD
jgi:hypothetical protein